MIGSTIYLFPGISSLIMEVERSNRVSNLYCMCLDKDGKFLGTNPSIMIMYTQLLNEERLYEEE